MKPTTKLATEQRIGSGALLDLAKPDSDKIDLWVDVAQPLGRIGRFTSQAKRKNQLSVAEHQVVGAAIAYYETGRADLALAFAIHDAHEAFFNDIATPIVATLAAIVGDGLKPAINLVKDRLDVAIARAGGFPVAWPEETRAYVKNLDDRTYEGEYDALWREPWDGVASIMASPTAALRYAVDRFVPGKFVESVEDVMGSYVDAAARRNFNQWPSPLVVRLDLSDPWTADKAARIWLACVEELRVLV